MSTICVKCEYEPSKYEVSERREMNKCDECGWICAPCTNESAINAGLLTEEDTSVSEGRTFALIRECESSGKQLCPECFEKAKQQLGGRI